MGFRLVFLCVALSLSGCAKRAPDPRDPFEPLNRGVFEVNRYVDGLYLRPLSTLYSRLLPGHATQGVGNFIRNLGEVPNFSNHLLQARWDRAARSGGRFFLNSTIGVFGLFDAATPLGLAPQRTDLGQTLSRWGWKRSSYLVLPLLGPSTFRDATGVVGDSFMSLPPYCLKPRWRNVYYGVEVVHWRSEFQDMETLAQSAGVDRYALVRNAYLQNRDYQIRGGSESQGADVDPTGVDYLSEPPA